MNSDRPPGMDGDWERRKTVIYSECVKPWGRVTLYPVDDGWEGRVINSRGQVACDIFVDSLMGAEAAAESALDTLKSEWQAKVKP